MNGTRRAGLIAAVVAAMLVLGGTALAVSGDSDNDGVVDDRDNCDSVVNPSQADNDGDRIGDACDLPNNPADTDGDGILNEPDNCDFRANGDQTDSDNDGQGDMCDPDHHDSDRDTVLDGTDNCTAIFNPNQADFDNDGTGDRCESPAEEHDAVEGSPLYESRECRRFNVAPNDDTSRQISQAAFLPQQLNFFGLEFTKVFVNNNGNITFDAPLGTFTPFAINADTPPIIAPFFADVDTRPPISGQVSFGVQLNSAIFGGHDVFCAQWEHVGYYENNVDKRNTFQLLLVERDDVAPGDFDIYFNYPTITWETGDASGGTNGLNGTRAGAGYSSGSNDVNGFFSMPCSRSRASDPADDDRRCLDNDVDEGLARTSTNSLIGGRHIFPIRSGGQTFQGSLRGRVTSPSVINGGVVNANVEVCHIDEAGLPELCRTTRTVAETGNEGGWTMSNLQAGDYRVRVLPTGNLIPETVDVEALGATEQRVVDFVLDDGIPPPHGTTFGTTRSPGFIPHGVSGRTINLLTEDCNDGAATYFITVPSTPPTVVSGPMLNDPNSEDFTAQAIVPDYVGPVDVRIEFDGECADINFDAYIDPSGFVVDETGAAIPGATVTLLRADAATGPFVQVPDGDVVMSPTNRTNPDATDADGHFGWDVLAGFYVVRASAPGCSANQTPVLTIPPPVTDLEIVLDCGSGGGVEEPPTVPSVCPTTTLLPTITDIAGSVHRANIECLLRLGLSRPGETFRPTNGLTRGQAAAMLARLLADTDVVRPLVADLFDDDDGHIFESDLDTLGALGILTGDGQGNVNPDELLSRAQLAALVVRTAAVVTGTPLPPADTTFPDVGGALADAIGRAARAGLVLGRADGTFDPSGTARREQVATVLVHLLELLARS